VLAFVVPLVTGHDEHWPLWGWLLFGASLLGFALFVRVEARVGRRGGSPVIPARVLRHPGFAISLGTLFLSTLLMMGLMFSITLHLQGALHFSALSSGLAFAPQAAAVFLVSMTWRRLPARWYVPAVVLGFGLLALTFPLLAAVLRGGGAGGYDRWVLMTAWGLGLGLTFSPLMGLMISRVPLADAADASGVINTLIQLGQVTGVATIGTLFLNLDGAGTALSSAHALVTVLCVTAGLSALGAVLASRVPRPDPA
jgi:hypothetical protein